LTIVLPPAARNAIEAILEARWPGEWRRARDNEVMPGGMSGRTVWRLDAAPGDHSHAGVRFVWVSVDPDFPLSRMRVHAPGAVGPGTPAWPHVEGEGALCLRALPLDVERHVRLAISDAFDILGMDDATRTEEFGREFIPYWGRRTGTIPEARSLVVPGGPTRPIVWARWDKSYIFAEDKAALTHWLTHSGHKADDIHRSRLVRLATAPSPDDYPKMGADLIALDPQLRDLCERRAPLPVLIDVPTPGGTSQVAVVIQPPDVPGLPKRAHPVSADRRDQVFGNAPVARMSVMRQDHAWVHGRDQNSAAATLSDKVVGVVGCGALGSEIVRLLAAAGTGQFVLVDKDRMESANTTRHTLGASSVGQGKAPALSGHVARQFPHLAKSMCYHRAFEDLGDEALNELASCNLLIAAGVDALAIIRICRWRDGLDDPPPLLVAWTEEFACAGHAILVEPGLTSDTFLNSRGRPVANLTSDWPLAAAVNVTPAGCGSAFQPYTATDMMGTVQTTTRLALDVLLKGTPAPVHRVWLGDRSVPEALGAKLSGAFDGSRREKELL